MRSGLAAGLLFFAIGAVAADAATITSVAAVALPGASTGAIGPVGATPAPNNDNATLASPNVVPISVFFNDPGVADVEFGLTNSGGTTEYRLTPNLVDASGVAWAGFRFELGFGSGAGFVPFGASGFLSFDTPDRDPPPTSTAFAALDHQPDRLVWSGGLVPSIGSAGFTFAIDVPDGIGEFHPQGLARFTLRLAPVPVPEPASLGLLATGLAALAGARRRAN